MLRKVDGGSLPPTPEIDTAIGTESIQADTAGQPPVTTNPEPGNSVTAMPYDTGNQLLEHQMDGQMRAALLKSLIPGSGSPGPSGLPPTTLHFGTHAGSAGGVGGPAPASTEVKYGDRGPAVEEVENQLNKWRAENERKLIKTDGKFDTETKTAVQDFQKANGMKVTGKFDLKTRERIEMENHPHYKGLDDTVKVQIRNVLNDDSKPEAARINFQALATDPNLSKLSPELQKRAFQKLSSNPDLATRREIENYAKDRVTLETNENFKALDPVTQKTVRETMDKNSERAGGVPRTNLMDLATDPNFGKMRRAHQDLALKTLANNNTSATNLQNLKKMIASDSFQNNKIDDATKTRILNLAANNAGNIAYVDSLSKLASDPKFGALSMPDQIKTLNVFQKTTPNGRTALQQLLQREINGVPVLTSHGVNNNAKTVLDQLERITTAPLDRRLVDRRVPPQPIPNAQMSEQLLQELSDPDLHIGQSRAGTCTCTSMSHRLAIRNPAEYARIATDLAATGQSKLGNGDTISVPGSSAWQPDTTARSHTERLVQSSLMDYARPGKGYVNHNNGPDGRFGTADDGFIPNPRNPAQRNMEGWNDRPGSGLNSDEERRLLKGLYNKDYNFYTGSLNFKSDKKDIVTKLRGELGAGRGPINADLDWGNGGHAVTVYKIDAGRVYIRNPWGGGNVGPTGSTNGTSGNNTPGGPLRRVEDANKGEESMTIEDFQKAVRGAYVRQ